MPTPAVGQNVAYEEASLPQFVGQNAHKEQWPYVYPRPSDSWAGGRTHTFKTSFDVAEVAGSYYRLVIDFVSSRNEALACK